MKFNLFNFNSEKLPRAVRKFFAPSREFSAKAKGRFLATFDARYPVRVYAHTISSRFVFVGKTLAGALAALMLVLGGVSVYADTKNVPADNPLYPLKRFSETVQLAVTKPSAKADLQATFAVKRAVEINDLSARHPTSTLLVGLANDFDADVSSSLGSVEQTEQGGKEQVSQPQQFQSLAPVPSATSLLKSPSSSPPQAPLQMPARPQFQSQRPHGERKSVCDTLGVVFGATSSIIQNKLSDHSEIARRFMSACQGDTGDAGGDQGGSMQGQGSATSSVFLAPPVPLIPRGGRFENRGGGDDHGAGGEASATVTTTIEATTTVTAPSFFGRIFYNDN